MKASEPLAEMRGVLNGSEPWTITAGIVLSPNPEYRRGAQLKVGRRKVGPMLVGPTMADVLQQFAYIAKADS